MNTDDRALADLIARLLKAEQDIAGSPLEESVPICLLLSEARDRLEAFHAKPVVDGEPLEMLIEKVTKAIADPGLYCDFRGDRCMSRWQAEAAVLAVMAHADAALQSPPPVVSGEAIDGIAAQILRDMCELPDYDSPDDQPNLIQCTTDELDLIVRRALGDGQ